MTIPPDELIERIKYILRENIATERGELTSGQVAEVSAVLIELSAKPILGYLFQYIKSRAGQTEEMTKAADYLSAAVNSKNIKQAAFIYKINSDLSLALRASFKKKVGPDGEGAEPPVVVPPNLVKTVDEGRGTVMESIKATFQTIKIYFSNFTGDNPVFPEIKRCFEAETIVHDTAAGGFGFANSPEIPYVVAPMVRYENT